MILKNNEFKTVKRMVEAGGGGGERRNVEVL